MHKRFYVLLLFLILILFGCGEAGVIAETESAIYYEWMAGESPVATMRQGIEQQCIYGLENSFECTENGIYFMCFSSNGENYLLYGDHGSDTLIKLCGRADCTHGDSSCDAYIRYGFNVCYYDGYLYTTGGAPMARTLIRMDLDGTNRVTVLDTSDIFAAGGYSGTMSCMVWNGLFTICPYKLDTNGEPVADFYYYKLDGTMEHLEHAGSNIALFNDGGHFLVQKTNNNYDFQLYLWNPDENTSTYLTEITGPGYYSADEAYYAREGIAYRMNYETGKEEILFDSGLRGNYRLLCFPDCVILASVEVDEQADKKLYIYNWAYELVDQVELDYPIPEAPAYSIIGETPERIILSGGTWSIPRYYIEKADFGTGNVEIHEFNLPDVQDELAELDRKLASG